MKNNFVYASLLILSITFYSCANNERSLVVEQQGWNITYNSAEKNFNLAHQLDEKEQVFYPIVTAAVPEARYSMVGGEERTISIKDFGHMKYEKKDISDKVGKGKSHTFIFSQDRFGDGVSLVHEFFLYEGNPGLWTRLTIVSLNGDTLESNYLAPIRVDSCYNVLEENTKNRMLKVPFDNDSFVRYHKYRLDCNMTSYEVSAIFEGISRRGIILGSVEHDRWKSAINVEAEDDCRIKKLVIYSGVANNETRDVRPHGKLEGDKISSALMFIGHFADWRDGMEEFALANTLIQPARQNWTKGAPFGWQSWGVMAEKNSFEVDIDVSDYFKNILNPAGFAGDEGLNIISIDAWDNLSNEQKRELTRHCQANGQIAGTYLTPFCLWWNEDMLKTRKVTKGSPYTGYDCVMKVNGQPLKLDGAYCLDPTHPGSKQMMTNDIRRIKDEGFRYVKVDFTSNGMVQADSYYNPKVRTAVEAYNEGFTHFITEADKGEPLFVALSIAPIFPYQYGNSRRIACDTWGKIGHTEYSMNAVGAGWWTNGFYQYNDPDHLVLVGNDEVKETEGENRARVTNGATSGMMLVSDNYSPTQKPERGNAVLSFERAKKTLMNNDVNDMARFGRSARPVFGYKEYNGQADGAENAVMLTTEKYIYVSVINYKEEAIEGEIPFERLGITKGDFSSVKELWTGEELDSFDQLEYSVPGKDARIYRFEK